MNSASFPSDEVQKIIFHKILSDFSKRDSELSRYEAKELISQALDQIPHLFVERADIEKFGADKLFVEFRGKVVLLEIGKIADELVSAWESAKTRQQEI